MDDHKIVKIRDFWGILLHTCFLRVDLPSREVSLEITSGNLLGKNPLKIGISILRPNLTF